MICYWTDTDTCLSIFELEVACVECELFGCIGGYDNECYYTSEFKCTIGLTPTINDRREMMIMM